MNYSNQAQVEIRDLSFISAVHEVRPLNEKHVAQIQASMEQNGVQPFPLRATSDGVLFAGAHRYEALRRIGATQALISIETPDSLDRAALADNAASETALPMTFVDYAELVWARIAGGERQQALADALGWSRSAVADYAALKSIDPKAWDVVAENARSAMSHADGAATDVVAVATFTEGLLRSILPLTAAQQLELVSDLAAGKVDKKRFRLIAERYRDRNEMAEWLRAQLAEVTEAAIIDAAIEQITEARLDGEWKREQAKAGNAAGPRLIKLMETTRSAWRDKAAIQIIHGDFYEKVRGIGDGTIDAIITDPPYNISTDRLYRLASQADWNKNFGDWDRQAAETFLADMARWAAEFFRVMRDGASGFMFAGEDYIAPAKAIFEMAGFEIKQTFYWARSNPGTSVTKADFMPAMDFAIQFVKPGAKRNFNYPGEPEGFNYRQFPICGGNERLKNSKGETLHPTQKPEGVIAHLMELITFPGEVVFDGFMGVGTTPSVAKRLKRKCIAIEKDKGFYEAALRRLEA